MAKRRCMPKLQSKCALRGFVPPAPQPWSRKPNGTSPSPPPPQALATSPSAQPSPRRSSEERRKRKDRKRQERVALALERWEPLGAPPPRPAATARSPEPDTPWPCDPTTTQDLAAASSWSWGPPADPRLQPAAAAASQPHPQAAAVRSCRAFFKEGADDEEDEDGEEQEEGGNAARFFAELLGGDAALRGFYETEREKGQFLCLVCEGTGARIGKWFSGCAALVQHAGSVTRTKRTLAHRAFADAIDRLLGWGTGRTAPPSEGCDNDVASDPAENLGLPQSVEMDIS